MTDKVVDLSDLVDAWNDFADEHCHREIEPDGSRGELVIVTKVAWDFIEAYAREQTLKQSLSDSEKLAEILKIVEPHQYEGRASKQLLARRVMGVLLDGDI